MHRRDFLVMTGAAGLAAAATPSPSATVLYGDRSVALGKIRSDPKPSSERSRWQETRLSLLVRAQVNVYSADWLNIGQFRKDYQRTRKPKPLKLRALGKRGQNAARLPFILELFHDYLFERPHAARHHDDAGQGGIGLHDTRHHVAALAVAQHKDTPGGYM